jgi:hypothetical protein
MSIGGIRLAELGAHPLFLHAELDPEREEEENENDEPAHLGDGNRHAKETGQNAGVDGVTDHGIGTGGDQLVALLNGDGAAPVSRSKSGASVGSRPSQPWVYHPIFRNSFRSTIRSSSPPEMEILKMPRPSVERWK